MDTILCLLSIIQYLCRQNCWLINFIRRYIPLKQWAFDNSHSPKYQKFKVDELPLITDSRQDWTYKDLIPHYGKRYGKMIHPIGRHSDYHILDGYSCSRCDAPKPFFYKNNDFKGQLPCEIYDIRFSSDESCFLSTKFRYPHRSSPFVPKKDHKHFIVHKRVNPKRPYYLHNLKRVDNQDLKDEFGRSKYKLHYAYREFTVDFFSMGLDSLPKNTSSLKSNRHNARVTFLALTLYVNFDLSLRKTSQTLKGLYNISLSYQQIINYCKTAAVRVKPFVDQYSYEKGAIFIADETYIKIRSIKTYTWLIMNAASRPVIGYQVPDNCGIGPCTLTIRMASQDLTELPGNFKLIVSDYSAYPLVVMELVKDPGKLLTFHITRVVGPTNDDAASKEHCPFKQMTERLNHTYKVSYRHTNDFGNIDGVSYELTF